MRTMPVLVAAALATFAPFAARSAFAHDASGPRSLPTLPPPASLPASPPASSVAPSTGVSIVTTAPQAADTAPKAGEDKDPVGVVMEMSTGAAYLGGGVTSAVDIKGVFATFGFRLGYYLSPRVGFRVGVEGGYGGLVEGCAGECKNAYTVRVPITLEYAANGRHRGVYVQGGVSLVNAYGASTDAESKAAPEVLTMSSPVDGTFAAGVRFAPSADPTTGKEPTTSFDLKLGFTAGYFTKLSYAYSSADVEGPIKESSQAMHYMAGLSGAYHWSF